MMNRTGIDVAPVEKKEMLEVTNLTVPSMEGDEHELTEARVEYIEGSNEIGTIPMPAPLEGAPPVSKRANVSVLIDKLGERLAFERTGTRLYEALVDKCIAAPPLEGGPTPDDLRHIQLEELAHFEMVRDALVSLGADPTAVTPSADVAGVASMGILHVITDARTTLKQSLEAALIAELADNDGWQLLIDLLRAAGHTQIAGKFETALANEADHLLKLRKWITATTLLAARPAAKA